MSFPLWKIPFWVLGRILRSPPPPLRWCERSLNAGTSLIGTLGTVKDMSKFSPPWGIQRCCQGKLFSRGCPFRRKGGVVLQVQNSTNTWQELSLQLHPPPNNSVMSLIVEDDIPHRVNQISMQLGPFAVIHRNGGSPLDTPIFRVRLRFTLRF